MSENEVLDRAIATEKARQRRSSIIGLVMSIAFLSPLGWIIAHLMGVDGNRRVLLAPVIIAVLLVSGLLLLKLLQSITGGIVLSIVSPGGQPRGPIGHSRAEALAAAGDLNAASAEFESLRAADGDHVSILRAEAELHAASGDAKRAESLYQRIRRAPDAKPTDELYASHRLIDLYLGPLNDPGRVLVELRRMADRFPETVDGRSALAELKRRRDAGEE